MSQDAPKTVMSVDAAQERIEELESVVARQRREIGALRLQLDVLSTTDLVTGLPNVHGLTEMVDGAIERLNRAGEPFAVMTVQIPALRGVRGRHGVEALNDSLRHAGALIAAGLRGMDQVGRLDEQTFLVVLPALEEQGVGVVLSRVDELLRSVPLSFDSEETLLSPSLGIVLVGTGTDTNTAVVLERMYTVREEASVGAPIVVRMNGESTA